MASAIQGYETTPCQFFVRDVVLDEQTFVVPITPLCAPLLPCAEGETAVQRRSEGRLVAV